MKCQSATNTRVFSKAPNCRKVKFRIPSFAVAVALTERLHGLSWMISLRWVYRSSDSRVALLCHYPRLLSVKAVKE